MSTEVRDVLRRCRESVPAWADLSDDDFETTPPRGFSSFTMVVRCRRAVEPHALLYRHLADKPNALLPHDEERRIYEALVRAGVAAPCVAYERDYRLEAFYEGRSLRADDLEDHDILAAIGEQLARLHAAAPPVDAEPHFARLHRVWRSAARAVLVDHRCDFPDEEREMCAELLALLDDANVVRALSLLPDGEQHFCHNDTYHGNVMLLDDGRIRLVDFEFAGTNHRAFDFANLFAETVMRHGLADPPHFAIAPPTYGEDDVLALIDGYLEGGGYNGVSRELLARQAMAAVPLSDFMYALAALPLARAPHQQIRFIPYAHQRYRRFLEAARA